jgi:hypothetical protein
MGTLVTAPSGFFFQAYKPYVYEYRITVVEGSAIPALQTYLEIDSQDIDTHYHKPKRSVLLPGSPSDIEYYFEVDISGRLQDNISNTLNALGTLDGQGPGGVEEATARFFVYFRDWIDDGTGKLELDVPGNTVITSDRFVMPASISDKHNQDLDRFFWTGDPEALEPFFTNKPEGVPICLDANEFVAVSTLRSTQFLLEVFDASGQVLFSDYFSPVNIGNASVQVLGVGPKNLANGATTFINSPWDPALTPTACYYEIKGVDALLAQATFSRRFYLSKSCCASYEIHFLNEYGFYDTVHANRLFTDRYEVESETFDKFLPGLYTTTDRGLSRLQAEARDGFEFTLGGLREEDVLWLKELLRSPDVYINVDGEYCPIVIEDGSFVLIEGSSENPLNTLTISAVFSRVDISQRT